jgi:hypothetical protein
MRVTVPGSAPATIFSGKHRGLRLVKPGETASAGSPQANTFEQARRIVDQIEREIQKSAARERSLRLRLCEPVTPAAQPAAHGKSSRIERFLGAMRDRLLHMVSF